MCHVSLGSRKVRLSYETRIAFGKSSPFTHRVPATIAEGIEKLSVRCHCLGFHEGEPPEFAQVEGEVSDGVPMFDFKWHDGASPGLYLHHRSHCNLQTCVILVSCFKSVRCYCLGFHEDEAPEFAQVEGELSDGKKDRQTCF